MNPQKVISAPVIRINRDYVQMLLAAYSLCPTQVARLAGVHLVTVSKVLRNRRHVSPEKRLAVLRAIAAQTGRTIDQLIAGRLDRLAA